MDRNTVTIYKKKWIDELDSIVGIYCLIASGFFGLIFLFGSNSILFMLLFLAGVLAAIVFMYRGSLKVKKKNKLAANGKLIMAKINHNNTKVLECCYVDQKTNQMYIFKDGYGSGRVDPLLLNANVEFAKLTYMPVIVDPQNYNEYLILLKDVLYHENMIDFKVEKMTEIRACAISEEDREQIVQHDANQDNSSTLLKTKINQIRYLRNAAIVFTLLSLVYIMWTQMDYITYLSNKENFEYKTAYIMEFETKGSGKYADRYSLVSYEMNGENVMNKITRDARDRIGSNMIVAVDEEGKAYRTTPTLSTEIFDYIICFSSLFFWISFWIQKNKLKQ